MRQHPIPRISSRANRVRRSEPGSAGFAFFVARVSRWPSASELVSERQGEDDRCQTEAANDVIRQTLPAAAGTLSTEPAASAGGSWGGEVEGRRVKVEG